MSGNNIALYDYVATDTPVCGQLEYMEMDKMRNRARTIFNQVVHPRMLILVVIVISAQVALRSYVVFPAKTLSETFDALISKPVSTNWAISLIGVIEDDDRQNSVALIKDHASRKMTPFKIGKRMFGNATLLDIQSDRILFERNNTIEYKLLKEHSSPVTAFAAKTLPATASKVRTQYIEPGFKRLDNDIVMSASYRKNLVTTELTKVMYQAMALPRMKKGRINGFEISEIEAGSIYEKLGIRNHDVVLAINDTPLNDMNKTISLLNSLRDESEVTFEIERSGKRETMHLHVK